MVLVVNSGSSSLKAALFTEKAERIRRFVFEEVRDRHATIHRLLKEIDADRLTFVAHRVVHGGERFVEATAVGETELQALRELIPLAPLHNPAAIEAMEYFLRHRPALPQFAVFDTAFHATMPPESRLYAVDRETARRYGIRRYGFHGTSHAYVAAKAAEILGKPLEMCNLVTLHLGNGASACAIEKGKSVDTSMGMTPLEGLVMGTRSGDIDPGVLLFLQREAGMDTDAIDTLLNRRSGLAGLCGTNDMREILVRQDDAAKLAFRIYVRRIRKYIGAYMALLGKVDAVVFTGGVGEHAVSVRAEALRGMEAFGIAFDETANERGETMITRPTSEVAVLVIPTDEERRIFEEASACYRKRNDKE
jgi:acetate kinase